jgi:hypothetical protein
VSSRVEQAVKLMRRHDPQRQEEGFALLQAHAAEYVDELMIHHQAAVAPPGGWLLLSGGRVPAGLSGSLPGAG